MIAEELRIGNLLQRLDGTYFTVKASDIEIIKHLPEYTQPEPVVCTVELLELLGFKETPARYNTFECCEFRIYKFEDGWYFIFGDDEDVGTTFYYIHQLQNLYFAVTHKELDLSKLKIENY